MIIKISCIVWTCLKKDPTNKKPKHILQWKSHGRRKQERPRKKQKNERKQIRGRQVE